MKPNSRNLLQFRSRLVQMLKDQMGYQYVDKRKEASDMQSKHPWMNGPRADGICLFGDLQDINQGEPRYHVERPCTILQHLGTTQARPADLPVGDKAKPKPTRSEAIEQYFDLLYCGWEFTLRPHQIGYDKAQGGLVQYQTVQIVDWNSPRNNFFTVYEGWKGVLGDGVAWDLIVSVNHIPVVAVMLEPTTPGNAPCQDAYEEMRRQLDGDPCLSTYCLLCIISDGQTTLVGSPDDPAEWFLPWDVPDDDGNGPDEAIHPFEALLQPEALLRYLYGFVRPVQGPEPGQTMRYCAHCHQYYAVLAGMEHLISGTGEAYAVLPRGDEWARLYPMNNNLETTRNLFADYMRLAPLTQEIDPDDGRNAKFRFVTLPNMSLSKPDGTCVYQPKRMLSSPLANLYPYE